MPSLVGGAVQAVFQRTTSIRQGTHPRSLRKSTAPLQAIYVDLARGCNPSNTGALLRQETLLDRATSNNREN